MASEYDGTPDDAEVAVEEADVYKTTSSSNYVVIRRVRLYWSKFTTFHNIQENVDDNKRWILTSQCDLQPRTASEIKESCTKFVRPRGQWAITTLVKPKAIGTRRQAVKLVRDVRLNLCASVPCFYGGYQRFGKVWQALPGRMIFLTVI